MSKYLSTKLVPLKGATNLSACVVKSAQGTSYLRFALDTTADQGLTATQKSHILSNANTALGDSNIRLMFNAYRSSKHTASDLAAAMYADVKTEDPEMVKTFGGKLNLSGGKGFTARGIPAENRFFVDIADETISVLANPKSTSDQRNAVAPLSSKGNSHLIASSGGFTYAAGKVSLNFNIIIGKDQPINTVGLAEALDIQVDDPLLVGLCGGVFTAADKVEKEKPKKEDKAKATSARADSPPKAAGKIPTLGKEVAAYKQFVFDYIESLSKSQVNTLVAEVIAEKIKEMGTTTDAESAEKLGSLKASSWLAVRIVGTATSNFQLQLAMADKDISLISEALPKSTRDVVGLFNAAPGYKAIKAIIDKALIKEMKKLSGMSESSSDDEPAAKKSRSEK